MVTGTFEGFGGRHEVIVDGKRYRTVPEVKYFAGEGMVLPDGGKGYGAAQRQQFKPGCQVVLHGVDEDAAVTVPDPRDRDERKPVKPALVADLVHAIRWLGDGDPKNLETSKVGDEVTTSGPTPVGISASSIGKP